MSRLTDLLTLLGLLAACLSWMQLSRGRELAATQARRLCQQHGLQLLDDTVGLRSLRLQRTQGLPQLLRGYAFEVSIDGADRAPGRLWMAGPSLHSCQLPTMTDPPPAAATRPTAQIIDLTDRIRRAQGSRLH